MDLSFLTAFAVILLTFLPAFLEILRRRDRGSRAFPEQTAYGGRLGLIPVLERVGSKARGRMMGGVFRGRSEDAVIEGDVGAGKLRSETLEHVLKEAEELLREAEELLGEDDG